MADPLPVFISNELSQSREIPRGLSAIKALHHHLKGTRKKKGRTVLQGPAHLGAPPAPMPPRGPSDWPIS
jgi:hypothetical protein